MHPAHNIDMVSIVKDDWSPATRTASSRLRTMSLCICVLLVGVTLLLLPFARDALPKTPALLAMNQIAIIGTFCITAYLMYGHYKATCSKALLHLSAGCIYTAIVLTVQVFSFPSIFVPGKVLIGTPETSSWLWLFWHAGPAVSILLFSWCEFFRPNIVILNHRRSLWMTTLVLVLVLAVTIAMVTLYIDYLPSLGFDGSYAGITSTGIAPGLQILLILSLLLLWCTSRFRNDLHLWLGITLVALLCDIFITMAGESRWSLGWYAGRVIALISSSAMMLVYLKEINQSHQLSLRTVDQLGSEQVLMIEQLRAEIKVRKAAEEALQHSFSQLRILSDHQELIKNEERRRIAIDIHDDLGQSLMALKIDVSLLHSRTGQTHPRLNHQVLRVLDTIDSAIKSVRSIINDLHPSALDLGLCAAVEWLLKQFERRNNLKCKLIVVDDSGNASLDTGQTAAIFRIIQESLVNVVRHAKASEVTVSLNLKVDLLTIIIADNGIGMQPGDRGKAASFGLKGIKERINAFGGELIIDSEMGDGTTLSILIPASTASYS